MNFDATFVLRQLDAIILYIDYQKWLKANEERLMTMYFEERKNMQEVQNAV